MSGITKILTRTPSELGSIKTNKSPIVEENKQLPAEQWNTAADAIIEIQTAIGEAANPSAGSITGVLGDHEERISELEQNGGGGGGTPDRIESASGDAFVETTDDLFGMGNPGSLVRTVHSDGSAMAYTAIIPGDGGPESQVLLANVAVANADETQSAGIGAQYDPTTEEFRLVATGAPLQVEGPTESNHAATKGYVDARPGAEKWSEHAATQDVDLDGHKLTGLGAPTDASDAATKGYVDARPGADAWSEHPATQDVDLDGNKLTGLGAPTEEDDAATKAYVDGKEPPTLTRIERAGSYVEVKSDGSIEAHMQGSSGRELSINLPKTGQMTMRTVSSSSPSAVVNEIRFGYGPNPSLSLSCSGGTSGEHHIRASLSLNSGRWSYLEQGQTTEQFLSDTTTKAMPATVRSVAHGIHLAKEAHDQRALVEWWEPVWTPVSNVDSIWNTECQYTRTYRAAGGSLVTLEGTIEVASSGAGQCSVQVDLPVARVGTVQLAGTAMAVEFTLPGHAVAAALVDSTTLTLEFIAEDAVPHTVGFRASYRAA